jgi:hypothetical protein
MGHHEGIDSDLIRFVVLHAKLEHLAFVPPCEVAPQARRCWCMGKTGGWFERSESRGVVQHAFESLLVRDPRRIRGYPLLRRG